MQILGRVAPRDVCCCLKFEASMRVTLRVVPANAGTHSHRRVCFAKTVCHSALWKDHAVWVPAFAGTTARSPSSVSSPPRHRRRYAAYCRYVTAAAARSACLFPDFAERPSRRWYAEQTLKVGWYGFTQLPSYGDWRFTLPCDEIDLSAISEGRRLGTRLLSRSNEQMNPLAPGTVIAE